MFTTGFSLSVLHLKADDTYLQLKKDLEYLDLKVRDVGRLVSLGLSHLSELKAKGCAGLTKSGSQMKTSPV